MNTITEPSKIINIPLKDMPREVFYCPGAAAEMFTGPDGTKYARMLRIGSLKGGRLYRRIERTARQGGMSADRYHLSLVRIVVAKAQGRWPSDANEQTAVLNGL